MILKHAKGFMKFIREQGVVGLAIGLVLGTAVGALVKSLIDNVVMPPIGFVLRSLANVPKWIATSLPFC